MKFVNFQKFKISRNNMAYARKFVKRARKGLVRRAGTAVKKRYTSKSGGARYGRMVKDVARVVSMVNAEKKYVSYPVASFAVGQLANNSSGARQFDVTPLMSQGTDVSSRNGNSIKICSSFFQFQVNQQSSTITTGIRLRVELWLVKGIPLGAFASTGSSAPLTDLYEPSVFSGVIDMTSTRQPDHFQDYRLIASRNCYVPGDQVAGGDIQAKTFTMPIKWNRGKGHHIRYNGTSNSSADIGNGQIIMCFRADIGNRDTTASTKDVPLTAASSGLIVKMGYKHWFYDN